MTKSRDNWQRFATCLGLFLVLVSVAVDWESWMDWESWVDWDSWTDWDNWMEWVWSSANVAVMAGAPPYLCREVISENGEVATEMWCLKQ